MEENTIRINGNSIEALEDGGVLINGIKADSKEDLEKAINILIKATIAIVRC
ncbi:hypothetical protein BAOM_3065 [Peribacillus asahii]|uniref:Uncharacterized protein n=1 Tax=Peribacillus asahii TaxID=228899 RepID=A0A3T0KU06_9BACI|nr:hypothetical protein [Peribacillus asahii]AZV43674.1 hypothetical protein BAOM_3065 [Peribacillus asahii]